MKRKIKSKKLAYATIGIVVLMIAGYVMADMFTNYVNYSNEFTVDEPAFQVSSTAPTGDWHPAEDFTYIGTPVSGGGWADMTCTDSLWIASIDPLTITFTDISDDGMYCKIALASDPDTYLNTFDLESSQTYEFVIKSYADPKIKVGTWSAGLTIT